VTAIRRIITVGPGGRSSVRVTIPFKMVQAFGIKVGQELEIIATDEGGIDGGNGKRITMFVPDSEPARTKRNKRNVA